MYIMSLPQQKMDGVTDEEIREARRLAVWATLFIFLATITQSIVGIVGYGNDSVDYQEYENEPQNELDYSEYLPNDIVYVFDWITLILILPHFYYISVFKRWADEPNPYNPYIGNRLLDADKKEYHNFV